MRERQDEELSDLAEKHIKSKKKSKKKDKKSKKHIKEKIGQI